jgi:thioredoxin 1
MSKVTYIHSKDDWNSCLDIHQQDANTLVVCFGAPWCGPCKALKPRFEALSSKFDNNIMFVKVDIEECPELAEQFEITSLPTTLIIKTSLVKSITVGANINSIENSIIKESNDHNLMG